MLRAGVLPPLLSPYIISLKASSLTLITYVLGASANWLLLRFLATAADATTLTNPASNSAAETYRDAGAERTRDSESKPTGIILLTFLRDYSFWQDGARRLGVDIAKLAAQSKFICVDGLSELFAAADLDKSSSLKPAVRGDHVVLRDAKLKNVDSAIVELITRMNRVGLSDRNNSSRGTSTTIRNDIGKDKCLLLIDGLDFLMAALEESEEQVLNMIMRWRKMSHSVIITASADSPLVHNVSKGIEVNHAGLAVGLGHQSNTIMSLRLLDTGTAKDISGVVQIARGAFADADVDENEFLYFVGGDGNVKVFERGATF